MSAGAAAPVVGTAGWSLPRGLWPRFPTDGTHLQRYAARLRGVEINSSFYKPHRRDTYARWAAGVPDTFRFAVKLPRTISHERRLADPDAPLDRFAHEVGGLGTSRGPLLLQLPPSLAFEPGLAFKALRAIGDRLPGPLVCEPRHPSWFEGEAEALLREAGVSRVAADPAVVPRATEPGGAGTLVYRRLHGTPRLYHSTYDDAALAGLRARLAADVATGVPAWCIFDNTAEGFATGNALAVAAGWDEAARP